MLSKKYFLAGGRNFSAPRARPTHAEVRDHIDPQKCDHRASYMSSCGGGLWKTDFCLIFQTAQFSTFSTASTPIRHALAAAEPSYFNSKQFPQNAGFLTAFASHAKIIRASFY
jgi:hypothetical protein